MPNLLNKALFMFAATAAFAVPAMSQDSGPLLNLLVSKGIISGQEAEDLRAELTNDFAAQPAGKLNLSSALGELRISGDVRARYESRTGELPNGDHQERNRFRYRVRAGLSGKLQQNFAFGIRVESSNSSRSTNVTMGDDGGPFAKGSDALHLGQVYISWTPLPELTLTAGRMPNPLVTTSMVWDGDINPEGLAESYRVRREKTEYFATAAQFLYSGASTQNVFNGAPNSKVKDLFLFAWQGGLKYYVGGTANFFQVAPTVYHYVSTSQAHNPAAFRGVFSPTNGTAVNNLFILDVPFEYNWLVNGVPVKAFADIAINLDAESRARKWGRPEFDDENMAYTIGLQYGKASNPGEWDASLAWQTVEAFALDPNLVDSDLFDSRTNMQGWIAKGNYALGAATQLSLTLANAKRVNDRLVAPGGGDIGANNMLDKFWLLQADLNLKF